MNKERTDIEVRRLMDKWIPNLHDIIRTVFKDGIIQNSFEADLLLKDLAERGYTLANLYPRNADLSRVPYRIRRWFDYP